MTAKAILYIKSCMDDHMTDQNGFFALELTILCAWTLIEIIRHLNFQPTNEEFQPK